MSIAQPPQDRMGASPLMSNNPFRNKVASSQPSPQPLVQPQTSRPVSTNPFLDSTELPKPASSTIKAVQHEGTNGTTKLFESMNLNGQPRSPERRPMPNGISTKPEYPPQRPVRGPSFNHRPTLSEEERRRQGGSTRRATEMDIFADPVDATKSRDRRSATRRNSESSVRDKSNPLDPEEERKKRDRRTRDPRYAKQKPSRKLDIIDKLDVTSIYGTGLFHHDGPFDACNPHRNKRKHRLAPMLAFPKDSANMQIGGAGPVKPQMDYDKYHGRTQEAHIDFNEAAVVDDDAEYVRRPVPERSASFNPTTRDAVHGEESAGLGTSTFLEGAPASRIAIERRESELNEVVQQPNGAAIGGGLSRKKSLAQKIRGVRTGANRVQSPDSDRAPTSPLATGRSENITNPFFKDYDKEYEKKGQQIAQAEEEAKASRSRALSSPRPIPATLERQMTGENIEAAQESRPTGFLGRMKSLKKTKSRPERREAS